MKHHFIIGESGYSSGDFPGVGKPAPSVRYRYVQRTMPVPFISVVHDMADSMRSWAHRYGHKTLRLFLREDGQIVITPDTHIKPHACADSSRWWLSLPHKIIGRDNVLRDYPRESNKLPQDYKGPTGPIGAVGCSGEVITRNHPSVLEARSRTQHSAVLSDRQVNDLIKRNLRNLRNPREKF